MIPPSGGMSIAPPNAAAPGAAAIAEFISEVRKSPAALTPARMVVPTSPEAIPPTIPR